MAIFGRDGCTAWGWPLLQQRCKISTEPPVPTTTISMLVGRFRGGCFVTNHRDHSTGSGRYFPYHQWWSHRCNHSLYISYALTGFVVPSILKLSESINGQQVMVLIDDGSTNNFIQTHLAQHLSLTIHSSLHLRVTVGNGGRSDAAVNAFIYPWHSGSRLFRLTFFSNTSLV